MEVRRVDLANWTFWTSLKFTTGIKYQFHQGLWPDQRSGNPNHPSPPYKVYIQLEMWDFTFLPVRAFKLFLHRCNESDTHHVPKWWTEFQCCLTLIVPRAWEIGYTEPCINSQGKSATHFVYFWSRKTLPYTHLEATSYIPQQGESLHIWTTSLSTIGCYKNKYTIQFLSMPCFSRSARGNFKLWNWVSAWHYKG